MATLSTILTAALPTLVLALIGLWTALSVYLFVAGRRARMKAVIVGQTVATGRRIEASGALPELQVKELGRLAASLDKVSVLRTATALPERSPAVEVFARSATTHHGLEWFVQQASASRSPRANWRRISALRLLAHQGYSGIVPLLGQAVADHDSEIVGAAIAILGRVPDLKAADLLIGALKSGQYA